MKCRYTSIKHVLDCSYKILGYLQIKQIDQYFSYAQNVNSNSNTEAKLLGLLAETRKRNHQTEKGTVVRIARTSKTRFQAPLLFEDVSEKQHSKCRPLRTSNPQNAIL